jgi:hypothetical protein
VGIDYFSQRDELEGDAGAERMVASQEEREQRIADNLRDRVLRRLGSDRALVYYGMTHLSEADVEPTGAHRLTTGGSYLQRLADSGDLAPADVYTLTTFYEGAPGPENEMSAPGAGAMSVDATLARTYDLLRAEFDDASLGFDIDEAEGHSIVFETGLSHTLGEAYDGYLFYRDLNSWNGTANLPEADRARRGPLPPLRISRVVPSTAPAGNPVFLYGHVFTSDVQVRFGSQLLTPRVINENVCEVRVPVRSSGAAVDVSVERPQTGGTDIDALLGNLATSATGPQSYTLRSGFRY